MAKQDNKPRTLTKKHVARLERERRQVALVRTVAFVMIGIVVLLVGYGLLDIKYLQFQRPVTEVNGEKITLKQWQERVQMQRVNLVSTYQQYSYYQQTFGMDFSQQIQEIEQYFQLPEALGQLVLDQMVNEALIRQEADKRGITVSDDEVEDTIQQKYYGFFPDGTLTPTVTPTAFEYPTLSSEQLKFFPPTETPTIAPTLTPAPTSTPDTSITPTATFTAAPPTPTLVPEDVTTTPTPYTLDGYKENYQKTLEEYKSYGISEETFRSVFRNSILRDKLQQALTADLATSEEQVWARHILVDTEDEAQTTYQMLKRGADFGKVARENSKDTGSGADGGDLGWFGKGMMVPEFEQAAFSQAIGEIGEPVQSQFGFHIIQVIDRRELPLSASQLEQNRQTAFDEWLTTAKEEATINTNEMWRDNIPPMPDFQNQQQ